MNLPQPTIEKWQELAKKGLFEADKAEKCLELSKINYDKFLAADFNEAINSTASLATIKKYLGEEAQFMLLEESLSIINELVPAKNKISNSMIRFLIVRLTKSYFYLTVSEIIYALSKGICGQYGDVTWGAIGVADMQGWIDTYDNERRATLEQRQKDAHSEHNKNPFNPRYGGNENPYSGFEQEAERLRDIIEKSNALPTTKNGLGKRLKERLGNEDRGEVVE